MSRAVRTTCWRRCASTARSGEAGTASAACCAAPPGEATDSIPCPENNQRSSKSRRLFLDRIAGGLGIGKSGNFHQVDDDLSTGFRRGFVGRFRRRLGGRWRLLGVLGILLL